MLVLGGLSAVILQLKRLEYSSCTVNVITDMILNVIVTYHPPLLAGCLIFLARCSQDP